MLSPRLSVLAAVAVAVAALAVSAGGAQQRRPQPPAPLASTTTSVTIQQRMIIRVPRIQPGRIAAMRGVSVPQRWTEKKADKCVPLVDLAAAAITTRDSVDLLLNGGKRLRARFGSDCPALDFYSGFYVKMAKDGKVCAGRDAIRARSGGECRIASFRALEPAKP